MKILLLLILLCSSVLSGVSQDKKVEAVVNYYTSKNTAVLRDITKKRVGEWFKYCEKWKHLAGKEYNINMTDCMIATIHHETDGRWWFIKKEHDGTKSYGITQLNTKVIFYIEEILDKRFPEFIGRDIRIDTEKNIAGRFLWIAHRREVGKGWAYLSDDRGWVLYAILRTIK